MLDKLAEGFFAWTRTLQGYFSQSFGELQPQQYFIVAVVVVIAGVGLLTGRR